MNKPTLTSLINAHPKEIFKALEDRRTEIEWAKTINDSPLPREQRQKYQQELMRNYQKSKIIYPVFSLKGLLLTARNLLRNLYEWRMYTKCL